MFAPLIAVVIVTVIGKVLVVYMLPIGSKAGVDTWGMEYVADFTAEVIQAFLNATALRTVPCAVEVSETVPLEASMSVPLLFVGVVPSRV
jgi:hypothetical protein